MQTKQLRSNTPIPGKLLGLASNSREEERQNRYVQKRDKTERCLVTTRMIKTRFLTGVWEFTLFTNAALSLGKYSPKLN